MINAGTIKANKSPGSLLSNFEALYAEKAQQYLTSSLNFKQDLMNKDKIRKEQQELNLSRESSDFSQLSAKELYLRAKEKSKIYLENIQKEGERSAAEELRAARAAEIIYLQRGKQQEKNQEEDETELLKSNNSKNDIRGYTEESENPLGFSQEEDIQSIKEEQMDMSSSLDSKYFLQMIRESVQKSNKNRKMETSPSFNATFHPQDTLENIIFTEDSINNSKGQIASPINKSNIKGILQEQLHRKQENVIVNSNSMYPQGPKAIQVSRSKRNSLHQQQLMPQNNATSLISKYYNKRRDSSFSSYKPDRSDKENSISSAQQKVNTNVLCLKSDLNSETLKIQAEQAPPKVLNPNIRLSQAEKGFQNCSQTTKNSNLSQKQPFFPSKLSESNSTIPINRYIQTSTINTNKSSSKSIQKCSQTPKHNNTNQGQQQSSQISQTQIVYGQIQKKPTAGNRKQSTSIEAQRSQSQDKSKQVNKSVNQESIINSTDFRKRTFSSSDVNGKRERSNQSREKINSSQTNQINTKPSADRSKSFSGDPSARVQTEGNNLDQPRQYQKQISKNNQNIRKNSFIGQMNSSYLNALEQRNLSTVEDVLNIPKNNKKDYQQQQDQQQQHQQTTITANSHERAFSQDSRYECGIGSNYENRFKLTGYQKDENLMKAKKHEIEALQDLITSYDKDEDDNYEQYLPARKLSNVKCSTISIQDQRQVLKNNFNNNNNNNNNTFSCNSRRSREDRKQNNQILKNDQYLQMAANVNNKPLYPTQNQQQRNVMNSRSPSQSSAIHQINPQNIQISKLPLTQNVPTNTARSGLNKSNLLTQENNSHQTSSSDQGSGNENINEFLKVQTFIFISQNSLICFLFFKDLSNDKVYLKAVALFTSCYFYSIQQNQLSQQVSTQSSSSLSEQHPLPHHQQQKQQYNYQQHQYPQQQQQQQQHRQTN